MRDGRMMKSINEGSSLQLYGSLDIMEADVMRYKKVKYQINKEYVRKLRAILRSKLTGGNTIR